MYQDTYAQNQNYYSPNSDPNNYYYDNAKDNNYYDNAKEYYPVSYQDSSTNNLESYNSEMDAQRKNVYQAGYYDNINHDYSLETLNTAYPYYNNGYAESNYYNGKQSCINGQHLLKTQTYPYTSDQVSKIESNSENLTFNDSKKVFNKQIHNLVANDEYYDNRNQYVGVIREEI